MTPPKVMASPQVFDVAGRPINYSLPYAYAYAFKFFKSVEAMPQTGSFKAMLAFDSAAKMIKRFNSMDTPSRAMVMRAMQDNYPTEALHMAAGHTDSLQNCLDRHKATTQT